MVLHRQPSLKDPARKSWEAILGSRYFGPAKVVEEVVGEWCGGIRVHEPRKSGSRSRGPPGARGVKNGVRGAQNGNYCPGNERRRVDCARR
jgi:hypothetical protein